MIIKQLRPNQIGLVKTTLVSVRELLTKFRRYFLPILGLIVLVILLISQSHLLNPQIEVVPDNHFYQETAMIKLRKVGAGPNTDIRYTTDGSLPTQDSNIYQDQPLTFKQSLVLRMALFKGSKLIGTVKNHDVFVEASHDLPVISLITEPKNLWDDEIGIYAVGNHNNYNRSGSEWERAAVFHYYDQKQNLRLKHKIGLRLHGGGSRGLPQKPFRLYADYYNDKERFHYNFFEESDVDTFRTLILRNSATDWNKSYMRDVVSQRIARKNTTLDTQADLPVVVYLNGQYWGLYFLRERFDQDYFHQKYGVEENRVTLLDVPHDVGEKRGEVRLNEGDYQSDVTTYNKLLKEARKCKDCANYNFFNQYADLQNLIDYYIYELHFANFDWPYGNMKVWRYHNGLVQENPSLSLKLPPGLDGRYRWLLYDLDVGFGSADETHEKIKRAAENGDYGILIDDKFPFRNLFYNRTFQENYFNRYAHLLNTNLSTESVLAEIDKFVAEIETEMPRQIDRWSDEVGEADEKLVDSMDKWRFEVDLLRTYAQHRTDAMRANTLEEFSGAFQGFKMITLNLNVKQQQTGTIQVHHSLLESEQLPFSGIYFPNFKISITALPASGYRFSHWEGDLSQAQRNDQTLRLLLIQDYQLTAVFEKKLLI